jgi:hypothetical protein
MEISIKSIKDYLNNQMTFLEKKEFGFVCKNSTMAFSDQQVVSRFYHRLINLTIL